MRHYSLAHELTNEYIHQVWERLATHVRPTLFLPIQNAPLLERLRCEVLIASETFQYTGSFKFRAAYNLLSSIPHQQIITASSGNFGQAIAYACQLLGKKCIVVMPTTSAQVKIEAVQAYGGTIELVDVRKVSRSQRVGQLMAEHPEAFTAQAYDDYRVVAGNSTLGKEVLILDNFDIVVAPIGGGGLSSGLVLARDCLSTSTEIIGAEPLLGNDAARSLQQGKLIQNEQEPSTIADGARTLSLGHLNWEILRQGLADIIEVPDETIIQALRHCFRYVNLKVEPTGALALGAILHTPERFYGKRVCCIASGGNVDSGSYAQLLIEN